MRLKLQLLAYAALVALVAVSVWASTRADIGPVLAELVAHPGAGSNPWFVATLFDTYFAFLWFWAWVAYKERTVAARFAWLLLICGLGNIAMASYVLIQLWKLPPGATVDQLLLRA